MEREEKKRKMKRQQLERTKSWKDKCCKSKDVVDIIKDIRSCIYDRISSIMFSLS